ncbi:SDR family NAD(P)-dependent oxidoreductase [Oleiagrimonas sp.]|jgi:NAD(P)-dependent dehydrogenase (short-subunit alcohol dehydrogenase family)|uniref:SDR family NAD(P)-dependent oxidoreductase n=1 Tax=Oleiagrimonas sp. TaxID=2010330 RepID=UPI00261C132D|nr:SDR family NAD(P)-dependent oxidoreductase [Oleiagrimonas sp.]MDA3912676.1 SDR family NAD(P)-dependent oxidoreductase [Oleiagrimonas sp.]
MDGHPLAGRVIAVTGANRGIGLTTVRELLERGASVLAGTRDPASMPHQSHNHLQVHALDVTDACSCDAFIDAALVHFGRLDGLVNNAGILLDRGRDALALDEASLRATLDTNLLGTWRLCQLALVPMREAGFGRIVNLTSGWGGMDAMASADTPPAYGLSKLAVNGLTRQLAAALDDEPADIRINVLDPGWVRTDMGGAGASREASEPAAEIADLLAESADGPHGQCMHRGRVIDW